MKQKILLGAHTSAAGGIHNALYSGKDIGATTIQFFTANQRQWRGKLFTQETIDLWKQALDETGIESIMSHDSYLINLGSPNKEVLQKSKKAFREEITRCQQLDLTYLNFHPGSALTESVEQCLETIVKSMSDCKDLLSKKGNLRLLFEATAGQGSCVGCTFEQLAYLIEHTKQLLPVGVCIDTCHIFAAGYDIRTKNALAHILDEFDRIVGLKHLYALHLNDSVKDLGSRVDRHANIGKGKLGIECFKSIMEEPRLARLPKYLETPGGMETWKHEIPLLRSFTE